MDQFQEVKKTYNSIAEEYHQKRKNPNHSTWNDHIEFPTIKKELEFLVNNKNVLDLGCGTGILTKKISEWGGSVCGIDQSEKMLKIARKDFPELEFIEANVIKLPFKKNSIDIIASSLVMHYVKDLLPVFTEADRILKHNGALIFSMHHPFNESFNIKKEREGRKIIMQPYFHNNSYYWSMCDTELLSFHHTFENITTNLNQAGFLIEKIIECKPPVQSIEQFEDYDFASQYPTFCLIKAIKQ